MMTLVLLAASALGADPALSGTWVLAEDHAALEQRHADAVEKAIGQLPWAFRPVARPLLLKSVYSCGELDLGVDPTRFRSRCDDKKPFEVDRTTGKASITGEDGKTYQVTLDVGDDKAAVRFSGSQGGQENRYVVDDGALVVTREMFSPQLAQPVSWTVRYKRKEG